MSSLLRGVYAVARTKRRRFLWCAWWTGEPTAAPFRAPDAWGGGARTEEEARDLAEKAAGAPLQPIEGHWAGAWVRVRAGMPPFVEKRAPRPEASRGAGPIDPYLLLGVAPNAPLEDVKAAFRRKALEHHPDHGGAPAQFIALKRAYDAVIARRSRRPRRR